MAGEVRQGRAPPERERVGVAGLARQFLEGEQVEGAVRHVDGVAGAVAAQQGSTNGFGNLVKIDHGSGFNVIDSAALGSAGTVYLLYNTANGQNCVATMKRTSLGQATATSAYLEV